MKIKCIKTLHNPIYKRAGFLNGNKYEIIYDDTDCIFVADELNEEFSFSKQKVKGNKSYYISEYFEYKV